MSSLVVLCSTKSLRPLRMVSASIFPASSNVRESAPVAGLVRAQRNSVSTRSAVPAGRFQWAT